MALTVYDTNVAAIAIGDHSTIFRGKLNAEEVAVKRAKGPEGERRAQIEVGHLRRLQHKNIIKFLGACRNRNSTTDVVLELAEGKTLADELRAHGARTEEWKQSTIYQIADGLVHIHANGIQHLDLKPKNILFKDIRRQRVLIADFGMATADDTAAVAGSRLYCARDAPSYTKANDVHCLAMIACCIVESKDSDDYYELRRIRDQALCSSFLWKDSKRLETVRRALAENISLRPSAVEFRAAFYSPIIVNH